MVNPLLHEQREKAALTFPHFPTRQQAFVWRNWGLVCVARLARVLQTTEANVVHLARGMGLPASPRVNARWLERGYITIIRRNWHLVCNDQLLQLLDWDADQLAYTLKEDDFLWIKLGGFKPYAAPLRFTPLTKAEQRATARLKDRYQAHFSLFRETRGEAPFHFVDNLPVAEPVPTGRTVAEPGDIPLTGDWTVVIPPHCLRVETFARRFADRTARRWGIRLPVTTGLAPGPAITLALSPNITGPAESHRLTLQPDRIRIEAVDEQGFLRGLQWLEKHMQQHGAPRFTPRTVNRRTRFSLRLIYSYLAVYGDPLLSPEPDPFPHHLLQQLADAGVNGLWLHAVLYQLVSWHKAPHLSLHNERRLENLRKLVARAADYGMGIYLYFNEPRAMPPAFFDAYPALKGHDTPDQIALCTSHPAVQQYLHDGTKQLFRAVPDLAGLFTITMSENLTNCYSKTAYGETNCPRCARRAPQEVAAEVNRLVVQGARAAKPDAHIICWTWGYARRAGWTRNMVDETISLFPRDAAVMCTSEEDVATNVAGVTGHVIDYSISNVGPGERSLASWKTAKRLGMSTVAKIQSNITWECAAVPYLPAMHLIEEHVRNLTEAGVDGLMLSWTLGGCPSPNLQTVAQYIWDDGTGLPQGKETVAEQLYGTEAAPLVLKAWSHFSDALRQFPFHLGVAYNAPQNTGPANLLYLQPTGYKATMVGFPYDDVDGWRADYPADVLEAQFEKVAIGWRDGLQALRRAAEDGGLTPALQDALDVAEAAYCHFAGTANQIRFVRLRNRWLGGDVKAGEKQRLAAEMVAVVRDELKLAKQLHAIVLRDCRIGYEASNHYFYTAQDLKEKVLNCEDVLYELKGDGGE